MKELVSFFKRLVSPREHIPSDVAKMDEFMTHEIIDVNGLSVKKVSYVDEDKMNDFSEFTYRDFCIDNKIINGTLTNEKRLFLSGNGSKNVVDTEEMINMILNSGNNNTESEVKNE